MYLPLCIIYLCCTYTCIRQHGYKNQGALFSLQQSVHRRKMGKQIGRYIVYTVLIWCDFSIIFKMMFSIQKKVVIIYRCFLFSFLFFLSFFKHGILIIICIDANPKINYIYFTKKQKRNNKFYSNLSVCTTNKTKWLFLRLTHLFFVLLSSQDCFL